MLLRSLEQAIKLKRLRDQTNLPARTPGKYLSLRMRKTRVLLSAIGGSKANTLLSCDNDEMGW
jgi:hypothetical protein